MCGGDQPAARPGSTRSVSNRVRPDNPDSASRAGAGRALAEVVEHDVGAGAAQDRAQPGCGRGVRRGALQRGAGTAITPAYRQPKKPTRKSSPGS